VHTLFPYTPLFRSAGRLEVVDEPLHRVVDGGAVQLVLRREVAVQVGLGDAGPLGDVAQPAAGPAALDEDLPGGFDDQRSARLGRQPSASGPFLVAVHKIDCNSGPPPTIRQWRRRPDPSEPGSGPRSG